VTCTHQEVVEVCMQY